MARPINTPLTGEIWHLSIDDLLEPLPETPRLGGPGPFVINLSASTAPISQPGKSFVGCQHGHVYQIQRTEDRRLRYRLRLGPFASEDEAHVVLEKVREIYPSALTATAEADDLRAIATLQAKLDALQAPAQKPAEKAPLFRPAAAAPPIPVLTAAVAPVPPSARPARADAPAVAAAPIAAAVPIAESTPAAPTARVAPPPPAAPIAQGAAVAPAVAPIVPAVPATPTMAAAPMPPAAPMAPVAQSVPVVPAAPPAPTVLAVQTMPSMPAAPIAQTAPAAPIAESTPAAPAPAPSAARASVPVLSEAVTIERKPPVRATAVSRDPPVRGASVPVKRAPEAKSQPVRTPKIFAPAARETPSASRPAQASAPAPAPRHVEELNTPLPSLESTQTLRPLTPLELQDDDGARWFVIQLSLSEESFDPDSLPNLDIFSEYRLYSVAGLDQGRLMHSLRLGFFAEEIAAAAVASYLAAYYEKPAVKRISVAERQRFSDQRVEARKDIGATGRHAVIEITSERVVRENRSSAAAVKLQPLTPRFGPRPASRKGK